MGAVVVVVVETLTSNAPDAIQNSQSGLVIYGRIWIEDKNSKNSAGSCRSRPVAHHSPTPTGAPPKKETLLPSKRIDALRKPARYLLRLAFGRWCSDPSNTLPCIMDTSGVFYKWKMVTCILARTRPDPQLINHIVFKGIPVSGPKARLPNLCPLYQPGA